MHYSKLPVVKNQGQTTVRLFRVVKFDAFEPVDPPESYSVRARQQ
ncbi:hypothetical protein BRCON_1163 [Candidatus Sumerlaea chitinivorans]|uniref:Uncharacterized protein n=1 Tax=Sumerlaea chitinivorans TaxID=2250252 RepID=A0A2Z4Y461_SUMC1|nr:hypothetical protein BRCON_1163 [Candidatus Sumerlaea chitinivorans]